MGLMGMDILRIARRILASDAPSEVRVTATMADGAGQPVEYEVECSVGDGGFDVSSVVRVDTAQDVDPEAFKTMFGKAALLKLGEEAAALAGEISEARAEESMGEPAGEPAPPPEMVDEPADEPMDGGEGQRQAARRRRASPTSAPSGLENHEYRALAMDCLDQSGLSSRGQEAVKKIVNQEIPEGEPEL